MRVAVIGAGIIGVTTAFELAVAGHEVTVFERRSSAAEETSFANAGVIAPGYVTPWAAPGMPAKVARFLLTRTPARDLEINSKNLEDAFLSLTGNTDDDQPEEAAR